MKITKADIHTIEKQFALDCNLAEAEEIKSGKVYLAKSKALEGARIVQDTDLFFRAILFMGKAYLMADESIYAGCKEVFKDVDPEWFCKFPNLRILDNILQEYNHEIADTHIYFLPDEDAKPVQEREGTVWFDRKDIEGMKESNIFHNALCYSATQPDVIAVAALTRDVVEDGEIEGISAAYLNGKMKGMAGASLDGKYVRQIGIDVLEEYQGEGLATYLTSLIKQRIIEEGLLPFYGTSESHGVSRSVAIRSGFLPAWAEIYVKKVSKK